MITEQSTNTSKIRPFFWMMVVLYPQHMKLLGAIFLTTTKRRMTVPVCQV